MCGLLSCRLLLPELLFGASGQNACPISGADAGQRPFFLKNFLLGKV